MCGIAALVCPGRVFGGPLVDAIDSDMFHRGPDAGGRIVEPGVALVHRRLAILDPVVASDQPMTDASGRFTLVFNGEVYNYRELRRELTHAGVALRTDGDTEALLLGYRTWGEDVLDRLEGMYAFAILDRQRGTVVAARDPFGIKPLYMLRRPGFAMLSSEVRPMRHITELTPDPEALSELMNYRWAAGRLSNYRGIERIPGGTMLTISLADGSVSEKRFCDPLDTMSEDAEIDQPQAVSIAEEAVTESVKAHLASDVGYTVQLSGGVDSSLIAALAQASSDRPIKTFSLHLPGFANDERPWRDRLCEHYEFEHHEHTVSGRDFSDAFGRALLHMEGPTPHLGCVLLMLLCDRIRVTDKVVLTGEGGDEFFGGYLRYGHWRKTRWQARAARLPFARSLPSRRPFAGVRRLAGLDAAAYGGVYHDLQETRRLFPEMVPKPGAREALGARYPDLLERTFAVDQTAYLESLLVRQDKMAMAASVEARVPFVHLPMARRINRVPRRVLAPGDGSTKPVLKAVADRYLPKEIVHRRKIGLLLPYREWLADPDGLGGILDSLAADGGKISAHLSRQGLTKAVAAFRTGVEGAEQIAMQLVNIEAWLRSIPESTDLGEGVAAA